MCDFVSYLDCFIGNHFHWVFVEISKQTAVICMVSVIVCHQQNKERLKHRLLIWNIGNSTCSQSDVIVLTNEFDTMKVNLHTN